MRETKNLEFIEQVTNAFLKTVSAFANYGTGQIKFGIKDDGQIIGVKNPTDVCLNIENKINDAIKPNPDYDLSIDNKINVITLTVNKGNNVPYFYKSKAYKRNDSASVEVDPIELSRLILKSKNRSYDSLTSEDQNLNFSILEKALKDKLGIKKLTNDILITLELKNRDNQYTNAGSLLSDKNNYRGIDLVRFGENINIMRDRKNFENMSIIKEYYDAIDKYRQYYQLEEIRGSQRKQIELIPEKAFREAVANALVHRTWNINAQIKISMFDDRIEVTSPGGLPDGLSKEEYLAGQIFILRNPIIAGVFFRLGLIEQFGTGVQRILVEYHNSIIQPQFLIYENSITVKLPVMQQSIKDLSSDQQKIYDTLKDMKLSTSEIEKAVGFGRTKVLFNLNELIDKGYLIRIGSGRSTKYQLANYSHTSRLKKRLIS